MSRLEELRDLSDAATPGPWVVFDDTRPGIDAAGDGPNVIYAARFSCEWGGVGKAADAALIVAAVNWVREQLGEGPV